jgi:hypothetical protein
MTMAAALSELNLGIRASAQIRGRVPRDCATSGSRLAQNTG